jgi:hypothetical protein
MSHARRPQTESTGARPALHHLQLLPPSSLLGVTASEGSRRRSPRANPSTPWCPHLWLGVDARARPPAHQRTLRHPTGHVPRIFQPGDRQKAYRYSRPLLAEKATTTSTPGRTTSSTRSCATFSATRSTAASSQPRNTSCGAALVTTSPAAPSCRNRISVVRPEKS